MGKFINTGDMYPIPLKLVTKQIKLPLVLSKTASCLSVKPWNYPTQGFTTFRS